MATLRKYGTRSEVFDSKTALMTRGGLKAEDLILSRTGKIVSRKKSQLARSNYEKFGFSKRAAVIEEGEPPKKKRIRKRKKKAIDVVVS